MRLLLSFQVLGFLLLGNSFFLFFPFLYDIFFHQGENYQTFLFSIGISGISGTIFVAVKYIFTKQNQSQHYDLSYYESCMLVFVSWIAIAFFGCLPYFYAGTTEYFIDAYFEAVSGFTTSGATIFNDVESVHPSFLLWRSITQWLGGMGVIVLIIAIIPYLDFGTLGMNIYQAEVPGIQGSKLTPRIQSTAKFLWIFYCILTVIVALLFKFVGMNWFDAINHSLTTIATGGFSTKNESIAFFQNPYIEWIMIFFMLISSINYSLHYLFIHKRKFFYYFVDSEFKFYITTGLIVFAAITIFITAAGQNTSLRGIVFTITSIITSSGFVTENYALWPLATQFLLMILMIMGGCAGSTSGGIKAIRVLVCLKLIKKQLFVNIHSSMIRNIRINKTHINNDTLSAVINFIFLYIIVFFIGALLLFIDGNDFLTTIGSTVSSLGNVGPAFGTTGPIQNYSHMGHLSKTVICIMMIMGRLELTTVIILCIPLFWKR